MEASPEAPGQDRRCRAGRTRTLLSLGITLAAAALAVWAVRHIGLGRVTSALSDTGPGWVALALTLMAASMTLRAVSWHAALRAALPGGTRFAHAMRGLFIGVLVSSTMPANLGEPSRIFVVARRRPEPWQAVPVVAGTVISQSILNVAAVVALGVATIGSVDALHPYRALLLAGVGLVAVLVALVIGFPGWLNRPQRGRRARKVGQFVFSVRKGLSVLARPSVAAVTVGGQASAWLVQVLSVYVLLIGMHLEPRTGLVAAAAVVFAVNVTMLFPLTPGDLGVFQAAVAAVLHSGWGVSYSRGVAFGVVLQAIEVATAVLLGGPALVAEGLSLRQVVRRPLSTRPADVGDRCRQDEPVDLRDEPAPQTVRRRSPSRR
jgi:phosphatidylinositol alpha-mannosyltransferase